MICPKCNGSGWVPYPTGHPRYLYQHLCDYPGCFGGDVDCCDGLRENEPRDVAEKYEAAERLGKAEPAP